MTQDKLEELTYKNGLAIEQLIGVTKKTSSDVDRLVKQHERDDINPNDMDWCKSKLVILNPVVQALKYPKAIVLMIIGLYFMAISDFRALLLNLF